VLQWSSTMPLIMSIRSRTASLMNRIPINNFWKYYKPIRRSRSLFKRYSLLFFQPLLFVRNFLGLLIIMVTSSGVCSGSNLVQWLSGFVGWI
jgi:hypothetical protein